MNKKTNFVLIALFVAIAACAQEYYSDTIRTVEVPTDSLGVHPWDGHQNDVHVVIPAQSHWSIYLPIGFNVTDADFTSEKKHAVWLPTVGLGGTYHWNNTWALGLEYKFRNYKVFGSEIKNNDGSYRDARTMLKGHSHQADLYLTMDVFNLFRPQNTKKLFALDLIVGGGAIWYKNSIQYPNVRLMNKILSDTPWDYNTAKQTSGKMDKFKFAGLLMVGASAEFNINRSFQLGLRGTYHYTTTDQVDARVRVENNDGFFDCEVLLRYKFEPRNKSNVRNFMVPQQIANWNDGTYYEDPAMGAAKRAKYIITPQRDTLVTITRDTVWMAPPAVAAVGVPAPFKEIRDFVVFFENDVPELDNTALSITGEAAMLLKRETEYKAVVVGSCDNTGAVEYNKWLATQRSINVTDALIGMGIDSSRIYNVGRGIMQDDRDEGSYDLNRRVEIHIVTEEGMAKEKDELSFFEQYKSVKRGSAVRQPGEGKNASSSEALKEAIHQMKSAAKPAIEKIVKDVVNAVTSQTVDAQDVVAPVVEVLDKVTVVPNMTLSQLAKQYYGNGGLWPKIFEANRDRLISPDHLEEGLELIIPKLEK